MLRNTLYFLCLLTVVLSCKSETNPADQTNSEARVFENLSEIELYQNYSAAPQDQRQIDQNAIIDYLAENGLTVHRLPSGVYRSVDSLGQGEEVLYNKPVTIHYRGYTLNGQEFDNSFKKGRPMRTKLSEVIDGWRRGLLGLREGDKAHLYIPSQQAYGERGLLDIIEPNEVLIFEVEVLKAR